MILDSGWKKLLNKIPEVGKNKLARWAELETFINVIQPEPAVPVLKDHILKGKWNQEIFRNNNPVILELGCGKGEYTLGLSGLLPECNFIGVDIKGARLWRGAKTAIEKQRKNIAFLRTRIEFINFFLVLMRLMKYGSLSLIRIRVRKTPIKDLPAHGFLTHIVIF